MSLAYNNITTVEISNKNYKKALTQLQKSKALLSQINASEVTKMSINYNIASVYISLKEYNKAEIILKETKEYTLKNNVYQLYVYVLITEAELFEQTNKLDKSIY